MWIGDIDVPQPVLDAAEAGELVVFVGAGASRSAPSNLPDFAQLVRDIGTLVGREPTADQVEHPDVFLGDLQDHGNDVHQLVASAIDLPGSRPNPLHLAIAGLAAAYPTPRIVTTNYDRHLTSAAASLSLELDVYEGPALPIGDDFEGIVYLHGSLSQPPRRLVVTNSDFGHAYLREAWAARFLERMFSTYTVIFIGYSHGDVVMQYLARSLGPDHNRYVLTDDDQKPAWRRLGLTPVVYPNETRDHSALPASLVRWRELATMGQIEHRARIADLVSGEPPTIPEEVSYLDAALTHPNRARYFAEKARFVDIDRGYRWFAWVEGQPAFARLFSPDTATEPASGILMSWIADQYIVSEGNSPRVLRAFRDKPWPPRTWYAITHGLFSFKGAFPQWLNPWLQLVLQNAPTRRHDLLDMMLVNKDWTRNFDLALTVFEDRTRPFLVPAFDFGGATDNPRFEVELCGDEYWLTDSWTKIFLPVLDQHFAQILSLATAQISRVYQLLGGLDPGSSFDPVSFSRSAIEQHEQDDHRVPIDVLIDTARDSIEAALSHDLSLAQGYLDVWASSPDAILRRLAVHGWRVRTDFGPDEKLTWLLEQDFLWDLATQHEVFQLIKDALPSASEDAARSIVDAAIAGPDQDADGEQSRYRVYNLLGWIEQSAPELQIAAKAFEDAQAAHPDYGRREHPDLNHYSMSGFVEDALPFTATELHDLIAEDPSAALARLREFKAERHAFQGPTWRGALGSLQACVTAHPTVGLLVSQVLEDDDSEFRSAVINGWDHAMLSDNLVEQALATITGWDHEEIRRPASAMLSNGGTPEHPTAWHKYESARILASALWPTAPTAGSILGGADLLMEAINHPAGGLAEFWTKVVQWEWSQAEANWDGLPREIADELNRLTSASDHNGLLARTLLCSQLHFFFSADHDWCEARLLPLFDWTSEEESAAAWQGFLTWSRWNGTLLEAGLLEHYLTTTTHTAALPQKLHHKLAMHLTSIAIFASVDPATWLKRFVLTAPEDLRVLWAQQVGRMLTTLEAGEAPIQWDRWIRAYWSGRNQSVPRPFTVAEASATAGWIVGLPGVRSGAIDLALASAAGIEQRGGLLYRLKDQDVAAEAEDWARLLTHLLKNTSGQQWGIGHYLQEIAPRLREGDPPPDITELVNEAMRLGVTNAVDW